MIAASFFDCRQCGWPREDLVDGLCSYCRPRPATMGGYSLRPYQQHAFDGIFAAFEQQDSTLAVMPTGGGKTILFAAIAKRWLTTCEGRVLIVAHRDELIRQAVDKVSRLTGEECDVEMGDQWADACSYRDRRKIVVTSVQTMSRRSRMNRFDPHAFGLCIIDEAHHAAAKSYLAVIEYFRRSGLKLLGVTATPDRADERALGQVFASEACNIQLPDLIGEGWLVPIDQQFVHVEGLDLSTVRTTAGDLNAGDLAAIVEQEQVCHEVVSATLQLHGGLPTIIFAASVDQAERMAEVANRHMAGAAEWICGDAVKCPMEQRRAILERFRRREFPLLINCAVLLEGFDQDSVGCIAIARPTKSRSLYSQMIGRGTRPLNGLVDGLDTAAERRDAIAASEKPSVLVLDFVGNSGRHKLIHTGDILGGNYDDAVVAEATETVRQASTRGERLDMLAALRAAEEQIAQREREKRQRIVAHAIVQRQSVNPFNVFDLLPKREPGWHKGRQPTPKQLAVLEKAKIPAADLSFWQASQLIDEMHKRRSRGLCTYGQARTLARYGIAGDVSFAAAKQLLDTIAQNRWKPIKHSVIAAILAANRPHTPETVAD